MAKGPLTLKPFNGTFAIVSGKVNVAIFVQEQAAKDYIEFANRRVAKAKKMSRGDRWCNAASEAVSALETLSEIKQEYQDWYDNLPENLQQSAVGEKLSAICDLDIESALDTANEAKDADLPLGFGRD